MIDFSMGLNWKTINPALDIIFLCIYYWRKNVQNAWILNSTIRKKTVLLQMEKTKQLSVSYYPTNSRLPIK